MGGSSYSGEEKAGGGEEIGGGGQTHGEAERDKRGILIISLPVNCKGRQTDREGETENTGTDREGETENTGD